VHYHQLNVSSAGDRFCVGQVGDDLAQARSAIEADGFTVGVVTGEPPGYTWTDENEPLVVAQNPAPGVRQTVGSPVDLLVYDPASYPFGTCPPPPA